MSARTRGKSVSGLIFVKVLVVVAELPALVANVAAVVPDPLPVVMDLAPVLVDLSTLRLRAGFVSVTEVAPLEPAMMPKLAPVMVQSPVVLAQMTTVLTKVLPVFPALTHVLMNVLAVPQDVAVGLRKGRRRDARRSQRG